MRKRILILGIALSFIVVSALALSSLAFAVWPFGDKKVSLLYQEDLQQESMFGDDQRGMRQSQGAGREGL